MSRHERGPNATVARSARSALAITAGLASLALVPSSALAQSSLAPLRGAGQPGAIAGKYIVVMKNGKGAVAADRVERRARGRGGRVARQYRRVLTGFTATLSDAALTEVRNDPDVAYVERDTIVSLDATQSNATWGLDRIDQTSLPLNGTYTYTPTGAGVTAYIIDTGIRTSHQQFGGRASSGFDAIDGGSADDCNGHGTHVAGTVGGSTYGVAKGVSLKAVRVLDCNGSGATSGVIAGIDWVTGNHAAGAPAVANMSLGGGASSAMDQAVNNSIADGVTYAVAAGNSNTNACNSSPARAAAALTVASTTSSDARSSFSNYGSCVDLFAPGSSITSSWSSSDSATNTISGTSMATPHVAGTAALHLQGATSASPASVSSAILSATTPGKVAERQERDAEQAPVHALWRGPATTTTAAAAATTAAATTAAATATPVGMQPGRVVQPQPRVQGRLRLPAQRQQLHVREERHPPRLPARTLERRLRSRPLQAQQQRQLGAGRDLGVPDVDGGHRLQRDLRHVSLEAVLLQRQRDVRLRHDPRVSARVHDSVISVIGTTGPAARCRWCFSAAGRRCRSPRAARSATAAAGCPGAAACRGSAASPARSAPRS